MVAVLIVPLISLELKNLTKPILGNLTLLFIMKIPLLKVNELYNPFFLYLGKPPPL